MPSCHFSPKPHSDADVAEPTCPSFLSNRYASLTFCLGVPLLGGWTSSLAIRDSVKTWYPTLNKPSWTPSKDVFGPMWTVLYLATGYASHRIMQKVAKNPRAEYALKLYLAQLVLNFTWSPLFFGAKMVGVSVVNVVALLGMSAYTGYEFYKIDKLAGLLFVPYVGWIGVATLLNISILLNN